MDRFVVSVCDERNNVRSQTGVDGTPNPSRDQVAEYVAQALKILDEGAASFSGWKIVVMRDETLQNMHFTGDELAAIGVTNRTRLRG